MVSASSTHRLSDHPSTTLRTSLGSTSLTLSSSGQVLSELRYTAWGEVRYRAGVTLTDYTFTGQYSNVSDFGLMFYREASRRDNARWYDPALGRFTCADMLVPAGVQGYDRFAYADNDPVRYTDPSGHYRIEDPGNKRGCSNPGYCIDPAINMKLGREYSRAESVILRDMLRRGGEVTDHAVYYIVSNDVHIYVEDYGTSTGAKWTIDGNLIVNSNGTDFDSLDGVITSEYYESVVGLIAHEAKHLEQGPIVALSVYGEFEAWKTEEQVKNEMFGTAPRFGTTRDAVLRTPLTHDPATLGWIWRAMVGEQGFDYMAWLLPLNPFEPITNPWMPAILSPY